MNEGKKVNNFKSYLPFGSHDTETSDFDQPEDVNLKPRLLAGEEIIAEASRVLLFTPVTEKSQGLLGLLTVTNFKLSFITGHKKNEEDQCYQQNLLLGEQEVCLLSVDNIFHVVDKKKRILLNQKIPDKIKELVVVCKNFRVLSFSFKFSQVGSGKKIASALLHHASPTRHHLIFAYEYKEPYIKSPSCAVREFRERLDWERELERTGANRKKWRVSEVNENFNLSTILPKCIVIPASVLDHNLCTAAGHFRNSCPPYWVWGSSNGAALVRMADIAPSINNRAQENIMLENVRKCHPSMKQPFVLDLTKDCPSPNDIYMSYTRLRELCTPDSLRQYRIQDRHFYGLLDSTKWLNAVSASLQKACEAAESISNKIIVVLQEGDGCDMCCVISSLTQLLLDSHWRTISGFQTLIQKEWVALGHHFAYRLGHIKNSNNRSPLFLLFLDCVWQLLRQFPAAFEFTETYLTTVWDSAHMSIFDTFLFNNEHERTHAMLDSNSITLRSVWDWGEQFTEKDIVLFRNPIFDANFIQRLVPAYKILFLEIWSQCYFRWIPLLEIPNGGKPQIDLHNRAIVSEINYLQKKLLNPEINDINGVKDIASDIRFKVNSFFPFSHNDINVTSMNGIFSVNDTMLSGDVMTIDSQSLTNAPD